MADKATPGKLSDSALSGSEVKARLAQAEVHFSHYRWDDAIALFEAVLAAHPDHPAATQGWTNAVEQKSVDEELSQALAKVRASLEAHRFDEALALLNHAQTRGALSHILKYHSEIDGLRSEAQEGQEWQRRIEAAGREAEALAGRRRYDQALEVLDNTLRPLNGRGWEQLGAGLARMRDRLWAERDVSERVQFAQSAYERQDFRLATELAAALHEELPEREDVRRLHERARGAWGRVQSQLAEVDEALAQGRTDDGLALLAALRSEHPHNPDWQAIALRVHMDHGRQETAKGRSAMVEHEFEDAAEAFDHAHSAFTSTVEIFPGHPTAGMEQAEAAALRDAALFASQAVRDRAAFRWEAARQGWQASREHLTRATGMRGRDFGEVVAAVDAMLGEAQAALAGLEGARLLLAEGRQALSTRDVGLARESFRKGLQHIEGGGGRFGLWGDAADVNELREQLGSGLRESERVQKEVKKLLSQAEAAAAGSAGAGSVKPGTKAAERLDLLRRAYELWETAPSLAARLADELLAAASQSAEAGGEDAALGYCEQVRELTGAPAGALAAAQGMIVRYRAQREGEAALAEAAARIDAARRSHPPLAEAYSEVLAVLKKAAAAAEDARELAPRVDALREQAEDGRKRALAAQPLLAESEALAASGDWAGSAAALAAAQAALGPLAGSEMAERLAQLRAWAEAVDSALAPAGAALGRAEAFYALASDGDVSAVDWEALEQALGEARRALRWQVGLPASLPPAWEETRTRAEGLARRRKVLRGVRDKIAAGRGVDAIPALQVEAGSDRDPVILAVLSRLLEDTAGDAAVLARGWVTEAVAALGRGELATAGAYLELAQSYAPAAPQVVPEIRRIDWQMAALAQVRGATVEAREHAANGETEAALARFRRALELAADGEAGLPSVAKRNLHLLLDLEEDLASRWQSDAEQTPTATQGDALVHALLNWDASEPLVSEFIAPALARWWKLACRTAGLAFVEAQVTLGRDDAAIDAAACLVESFPRDRAVLALYTDVASRAGERLLARGRRRLERGQRLAARGAYAQALAEIAPDAMAPAHGGPAAAGIARSEEVEALADEAADLRAELQALQALSEQLRPLLQQMRDAALAGKIDEALAALEQAQLVDPRRHAATAWEEFDAIAGIIAGREKSGTRRVVAPPEARVERPEERSPRQASGQASEARTAAAGSVPREVPIEPRETRTPDVLPFASPATSEQVQEAAPEAAPSQGPVQSPEVQTPERAAPQEPPPLAEPVEPPAPFDLNDWLSNVTELGPEDGEPADES